MLTAAGPMLAPALTPSPHGYAPLIASTALHLLIALACLLPAAGPAPPDAIPPLEVELVREPAEQAGTPPPPAAPAAPPAPAVPDGPGAPRAASTPRPAPTPAPPTPAPEINLGNADRDRAPLTVLSDTIKPPAPDARYRNAPPHYPAEAAGVGAEGTVQLLAHVTTLGVPSDVVVLRSSGNASLDAAARQAVLLWHFQPARAGRRPVPFDYVLNVKFTLGDQ